MPIELTTAILLTIAFVCAAWLLRSSARPISRPAGIVIDVVVVPVQPVRERVDMFV